MCMSARSKRAEESATLVALAVEGDCVLDFCFWRDSYDSGHSKTNKVFSNKHSMYYLWCYGAVTGVKE